MSTCEFDEIMDALASALTDLLVSDYATPGLVCSRDFDEDFSTIGPEATPTLRVYAMERTLAVNEQVPIYNRTVQVFGLIKRKEGSADLLETDGLLLEKWLDKNLLGQASLGGHHASIFQRPGQSCLVAAEANECWVVYEATLQYASAWE